MMATSRKGKRPANKRLASGVVKGTQTRQGRQGNTRASRVGQAVKRERGKAAQRFGPHNDSAPDPDVKTKKPFNPFNLGARVDEAKRGVGPGG